MAQQTYDGFRRLAADAALSKYERIGFPDAYRAGFEPQIFADILRKLPQASGSPTLVVDIGPGCSDLPHLLIETCAARGHRLVLVDSQEMLDQLPDRPFIRKVAGRFPEESSALIHEIGGTAGAVLSYSVFHYVFAERSASQFFDAILDLLAPAGAALIGDIPNFSKRRRFFASETGKAFHRAFTGTETDPVVDPNEVEAAAIDDGVLDALVARGRARGFDTYLGPQAADLPMANRRDDLLVFRP